MNTTVRTNEVKLGILLNVSHLVEPTKERKAYHVGKKCSYCGGTYSSSEMAGSDICVYCADNLGR